MYLRGDERRGNEAELVPKLTEVEFRFGNYREIKESDER
ncbi:hypothetical protein COLO4_36406 [Corchorus olitorius]|uniref:Uncharacterized protein n=1 Tax=Corchorus olitorius TaxID=93759 RepID=A0A1R3G945_9ROSI|nr:hypothetical protein COLO4_36406 [Corchorus olitorius]